MSGNLLHCRSFATLFSPYSPDLNPTEEAFLAAKSFLKANEEIASTLRDIEDILLTAFGNVTPGDFIGWYWIQDILINTVQSD